MLTAIYKSVGAPIESFTSDVIRALQIAFSSLCSVEDAFIIDPDSVSVTSTALTNKQAGVAGDLQVVMPSNEAATDVVTVLKDETRVLAEVNTSLVERGSDVVLTGVDFQGTKICECQIANCIQF